MKAPPFPRLVLTLFLGAALTAMAQEVETRKTQAAETTKAHQFVYVLHLVPRLYADDAWTERDKRAVGLHFGRFEQGIKTGQVIRTGRTNEPGDKTFGIVIFMAADEAAARKYMEDDPVLLAGIMTAELHPFMLALERKNP